MLFNSFPFLIFLPIVVLVYYRLSTRAQNIWLVFASWVFYAWWDEKLLFLLLGSIALNYLTGLGIANTPNEKRQKTYLTLGILANLVTLGFFKYFNFFIESAQQLSHLLGWQWSLPFLQVVLPIGISFYTFLGISYIVDVYNGKIPVRKDFFTFSLFISYFPLLVSGPIVSPAKMLPALEKKRQVNLDWIRQALFLMLLGFFKKVGIADAIAPQVNTAFANVNALAAQDLLFAMYLFAIQIYCDFSGYTDIARGVSKLFGIDLMLNFNQPYLSTSITDFWRRWHISLSAWFRNYVFLPLEFSRKRQKVLRQETNILIVFLLTGLWHGANWTFVAWGGTHGLFLSLEKWANDLGKKMNLKLPQWTENIIQPIQILFTFNLVSLTWIFFRASNFSTAWNYLVNLFTWKTSSTVDILTANNLIRFSLLGVVLFAVEILQWQAKDHTVILRWPWPVRSLFYALLIVLILVLGGLDAQAPFIYFQF